MQVNHKFTTASGKVIVISGTYSVAQAHIQAQKRDSTATYKGMTISK